jgi:hypothetical protein
MTLGAVFGAFVAAGASAQVVLAPSAFRTAALPSNAITSLVVACPRGYAAVSGGVFRPAPGTALLTGRPAGLRAYSFRFGNPVRNPRQHVTVAAACRRVDKTGQGSLSLRLRLLRTKPVTVAPRRTATAGFTCPARMVTAGSGQDLDPARRQKGFPPGAAARLSVRRETSSVRSFSFAVRNSGSAARSVVFYGNCVTLVTAAGKPRKRLHVTVTTFTGSIHPGSQTVTHTCPRGWFSLAAGFAARSPLASVDGATAVGSGGRWSLSSDARGPATVELQLTCGRIGS